MMLKISDNLTEFNSFLVNLKRDLCDMVASRIEQQLEKDVDIWLHRNHYQRREDVGERKTGAICCRCGSRRAQDFSRNGHRERQIVTTYGVMSFWLPRVVCKCGGSVKIPFSILEPYQRLWDDLTEQVSRWASLGLSLRQMQGEIGYQMGTQIGLRKFNEMVQDVENPVPIELTSVPPVIMLDAIWVTLLKDTKTKQKDKKGRKRIVKERNKVCILVALGIYPQNQRWGILGWELADSEDQAAWERLLVPLENRGLYRERGLELLIHDGGKGLIAALNFIYPHIPHQRCLFHKLRNLWHAIQTPEGMLREDKKELKRELIQQVAEVFYASTPEEAYQLRDAFCSQWQDTQPEMVATLKRDWKDSIAFYRVLARFPKWPRRTLRTTSLLERVNRILRRLFRAAGAYHSTSGLLTTVARVLSPMRLI
jgi:transposase-like protein